VRAILSGIVGLNAKQQRFVEEYLVDLNATQAAMRAGYSAKSANKISGELLGKTGIQDAIKAGLREKRKRSRLTADRVLREIANLAYSDIGDILDFTGDQIRMKAARDIPAHARRCIKSFKAKRHFEGSGDNAREVEVIEFQLWDKTSSLEKLAQHLNLYRDKPSLELFLASLPATIADAIRAALEDDLQPGGDSGSDTAYGIAGAPKDSSRPGLPDAGSGPDAGPVAGADDRERGPTDSGVMYPTSGEVKNGSDAGSGPLLD